MTSHAIFIHLPAASPKLPQLRERHHQVPDIMSEFYARYVPPTAAQSSPKRPNGFKSQSIGKKRKVEESSDGHNVLSKYSVTKTAQEDGFAAEVRKKSRKQMHHPAAARENTDLPVDVSFGADASATNRAISYRDESLAKGTQSERKKHSKVLSRFVNSRDQAIQTQDKSTNPPSNSPVRGVHPDRVKLHDLEPIPQPELSLARRVVPLYSTAPEWLKKPISVDNNARKSFGDFGLSRELLSNLKNQEKKDALPIQTAVLPLLLDRPLEKRPDLCVAAATGSGKTFAYVLPIIDSLKGWQILRLQAVIIVPTRALVKQVVQTIRSCSSGLDLRVGSAEGSKTLAEEQRHLVQENWVYDPSEYKRQQETPMNWGNLSLSKFLDDAEKHDLLHNVGHVREYCSKVNILVCTPGRLVEHLQSTTGFNLDDVQWFVVDEADRLLNESYHEWLDSVMPALKSQRATEERDKLLRQSRIDVPERRVNKILLSATMTNDLSRLMGLELRDPKLVIVEDALVSNETDDTKQSGGDIGYQLPAQLHETAIPFKDSENKPLYLLELLNQHIFKEGILKEQTRERGNSNTHAENARIRSDDSSASSTSSSELDTSDSSSSSSSEFSGDDEDDTTSTTSDNSQSSSSSELSSKSSSQSSLLEDRASKNVQAKISTEQARQSHPRVLVFTKSTESAHRLSRLLCILQPQLAPLINTFTRSAVTAEDPNAKTKTKSLLHSRNKILASFANGRTRLLISTDLAARGLDIPHLEHVVNYDVPASALTYIHRVGRTARAGEAGQAWTLLEHKQGKWFWETIGGKMVSDNTTTINRGDRVVRKINMTIDREKWTTRYEEALKKLSEDVHRR